MLGHVGERLGLAAPPRGDRRYLQFLIQEKLAQSRQERGIRRRFRQSRTECIGDRDLARPDRLHQAWNAQHRIAAQFERIAEVIVLAAHDDIDGKQPAQRFQEHAVVAHREIAALDQRVAEVAGEKGVFEIGLVIRTRRQQHDARILTLLGHQPFQRVAIALKEIREPADVRFAEHVGQHARGHQPVFERVARARRRLRAIREHPPLPVGRARQIGCVGVQVNASRRLDPPARPQKRRIRKHQFGGQQPFAQQALLPVQIGKNQVEQRRSLDDACLDGLPLGRLHHQRDRIERPGARGALRIAIDVVGNAVVVDEPAAFLPAAR